MEILKNQTVLLLNYEKNLIKKVELRILGSKNVN